MIFLRIVHKRLKDVHPFQRRRKKTNVFFEISQCSRTRYMINLVKERETDDEQ